MASIALPARLPQSGDMRPLNIMQDLPKVADLIELCFESTLDEDGQSYLQQMRRAGNNSDFLGWAGRVMESTSMPLSGFVWEEDGKIIGNVSLVYQSHHGRKIALIANVATHPNYRKRGIGRALTERAMAAARLHSMTEIWLQVRDDNPTAIHIYEELGFTERARRTTYRFPAGSPSPHRTVSDRPTAGRSPETLTTSYPNAHQWPFQHAWLDRAHPEELSWYARWDWNLLGPGLRNMLQRLFLQADTRQWTACRDGDPLATVFWMPTQRVSNTLWIAAPPDADETGLQRVLEAAQRDLAYYRSLSVEHPAGEMAQAIEAAGFIASRTLIWMRASATRTPIHRIKHKKEI